MTDDSQIDLFRTRLAETIAWCEARADAADPKRSLRSPELQPPGHYESLQNNIQAGDPYFRFWQTQESAETAVAAVAAARASLLVEKAVTPYDGLTVEGKGRLLLFLPNDTPSDGLSETETDGFLNENDESAWDTWVWTFAAPREYRNVTRDETALLSWVPEQFIDGVEIAIAINCTDCIAWADNQVPKYSFLQELRDSGLLLFSAQPKKEASAAWNSNPITTTEGAQSTSQLLQINSGHNFRASPTSSSQGEPSLWTRFLSLLRLRR